MERSLLVLLLLAAPLRAQVRVVVDAPAATAPVPVFSAPTVSLSAPTLTPILAAPTLSHAVVARAPALAAPVQAAKLSADVSAAVSKGQDPAPVLAQAYDVSAKPSAAALPVLAGPSSEDKNAPLARATHANIVSDRDRGIKTIVHETVEVGAVALPFAFGGFLLRTWMSDPHLLVPAMIGLWALAAFAMRDHLRGLRSTVVGGWQASHDQRYRVDTNTGRLRDVRGHKYGEDRYDEYAKGPAGRAATVLIGAAAALSAAAFLLL